MYLHDYGDGEASFTKEEMQSGKHQDYEQKLADTYLTPQTPNPNLATQLSTSSSRSATGDAGTNITNGPTSSNNSKTSASNQRSAVFRFFLIHLCKHKLLPWVQSISSCIIHGGNSRNQIIIT